MRIRKPSLTNFILLCLVLNLFLLRPGALGQSFTPLAMGTAVALVGVYLAVKRTQGKVSKTSPLLKADMVQLGTAFVLYWIYIVPASLLGNSNMEFLVKELLSSLTILMCYGIVLIDKEVNSVFFRKLCTVISLIGWSSCITILIGSIVGFDALHLFTVQVKGYEGGGEAELSTGAIYFPFSMLYTRFTSGDFDVMRFNGFFREAGIFQAVACFCLAYEMFTRRSRFVALGLIGGTISAFSSLGIVVLIFVLGVISFERVRNRGLRLTVAVIFLLAAYPVAMYTPYIGLEAKRETHAESLSDRSGAVANSLNGLMDNPFGTGAYSAQEQNSGINLLSASTQIGIFGFLIQFFILSGWRLRWGRDARMKVLMCSPLLITALTSQPIAGAPMMYVLPMVFISFQVRFETRRRAAVAFASKKVKYKAVDQKLLDMAIFNPSPLRNSLSKIFEWRTKNVILVFNSR